MKTILVHVLVRAREVEVAACERDKAGLLVMGCYGHSRFREIVLRGVSRTVLRGMTVPALMAH